MVGQVTIEARHHSRRSEWGSLSGIPSERYASRMDFKTAARAAGVRPVRRPAQGTTGIETEGMVRVGPLMSLPDELRTLGVEPVRVLAEVGLDPGFFEEPENRLFYRSGGVVS